MESVLTYILQINLLLSLVFLGYHFLLQGLTFYSLNRIYFVVGVLYSLIYPFLDLKSWFQDEVAVYFPMALEYVDIYVREGKASGVRLIDVILGAFAIGGLMLLIRLVIQLFSLLRIHMNSKMSKWGSYFFQNVIFPIVPFSFFNKIYIHEQQHADAELCDIFKHEDVHVKGLHTLDILLFEMLLIGCWYNPFVWLMRKAVRQNLEFLTDQQVLDRGIDRQTYQYSLLNVTKQGIALEIGNQFNFKTLKKRIMMMNKKRSSKIELSKYAFLLPVVILAGATFTINKAEGKIEELVDKVQAIPVDVVLPIVTHQQDLPEQDTLKGKIVGLSINDDTLQIEADQKGFPVGIASNGDQLFVNGRLGFVDVLTVLDGEPVTKAELDKLSPDNIESITVLKDKAAIDLYGNKGKKGVLLIVTKFGAKKNELKGGVIGIQMRDTTKSSTTGIVMRSALGRNAGKAMFVVDDKEMPADYDFSKLSPDAIERIEVLKDGAATTIYGDKGKDGVIIVTTKSMASKRDKTASSRTWTLSPNATKEEKAEFYAKIGTGVKGDQLKEQQKVYKDDIKEVTVIGYASNDSKSKPIETLDRQPEPEGGMTAFRKWIGNNLVYPSAAIEAGVKGTIQVAFIVEKDGSLSNVQLVRDLGYGTGDNAIKLINRAPKWKPGLKNGEPVRVEYNFPIRLDLTK